MITTPLNCWHWRALFASIAIGAMCCDTGLANDVSGILIKLPSGQLPDVVPLSGLMLSERVGERGILIWSSGPTQFLKECQAGDDAADRGQELIVGSRAGELENDTGFQPGDALNLHTAELEQIRALGVLKGRGFLTPTDGEHLLNGRLCLRRSPSGGSVDYPAIVVEVIQGVEVLCQIPFAINQSVMKWADVPELPASLADGLPPGEYSLRCIGTSEYSRFLVDDPGTRDFILQGPEELTAILEDGVDPLSLQVSVSHLLAQVDDSGAPRPYYSAALEFLDAVPPDRLTPWLRAQREDILRAIAGPSDEKAAANHPEDATGIAPIDLARRLIAEGRWDTATSVLRGDDVLASARGKGLALLYRAVVLSESGPFVEDDARALFLSAIAALSAGDPHDAYRARINFGNFLVSRAQDRLYNHAFEIASGVPNSLTAGLADWREAVDQYQLAGIAASGLDRDSEATVDVNLARAYSLLADVLQTLAPIVSAKQEVEKGAEAARHTAEIHCRRTISAADGSVLPITRAAAQETLAHLEFRRGAADKCRENASQARMLYLAAGSLPGIEGIHRLLGLLELMQSKSTKDIAEATAVRRVALRHLRISQFLSEFLRSHIPADRIGLTRAGYFARRAYVNEQMMEILIAEGRYTEALESAEVGKARSLQDVLAVRSVKTASDDFHQHGFADMLAAWPENTCALEYYLGSTRAWVFLVRCGGEVHAYELCGPTGEAIPSRDIITQVRSLLAGMTGLNRRGIKSRALALEFDFRWQDELHSLFKVLIPEDAMAAIRKAETLVVVPHHVLHYVPFVALVTETDTRRHQSSEMVRPRFLLEEQCTLLYSPSLLAWYTRRSMEAGPITAVRGLGDSQYSNLPGIASDLKNLSSSFGSIVKVVCSGSEMSETSAKSLLKCRGLLYIGSHGENCPDRPLESRLLLRGTEQDDGNLTAREIYEQAVESDLVVLSACYSGLADRSPMPGDDLFGLQRALLQSGSRTVVSGQWDIDDHFGMLVIQGFFAHLAGGENASVALRNAQLDVLAKYTQIKEGPRQVFTHPYFWAVLSVCGDDRVHVKIERGSER